MLSGLDDAISAAPLEVSSQLDYKLPPVHAAAKSRQETCFFASGSGAFGPGQVKQMRFNFSDSNSYLDPGSCVLRFKLNNLDSSEILTTLGPAFCLVERVVIRCNGTILEDIQGWNRLAYMQKYVLEEDAKNKNYAISGGDVGETIGASTGEFFTFPLWTGLLGDSDQRLFPLRYMPLQIEVTTVGTFAEFADRNWSVTEAMIMASTVTLDDSISEGLHRHMMTKSIQIPFSTAYVMQQSVEPAAGVLHLSKAASRIDKVLVTFSKSGTDVACRDLRAPVMGDASKLFLSIGAHKIPETPISGLDSAYYYLELACGPHMGPYDITKDQYTQPTASDSKRFILGFPTAKMLDGTPYQGLNAKGGQLISLHWNAIGTDINRAHVTVFFSAIASVGADGCELLD